MQRQLLKSFKDGIKGTFTEELSRLTLSHLFGQSKGFIIHYALYKVVTMIYL